nr:cold-regulated 47 [Tanacetum cinerariifolium]
MWILLLELVLMFPEMGLLLLKFDKVISPFAWLISLIDHTIEDEFKANTGKRKRMTRHVIEWFVVTTYSFECGDNDVSLRVKSPLPSVTTMASSVPGDNARTSIFVPDERSPVDEFYESQTIDSTTAQDVYNLELLGKISALESVHKELSNHVSKLRVDYESFQGEIDDEDKLRGEFASLQDAAAWHFEEQSTKLRWILGHGVRFAVIKCAQSSQCRSALGKVISLAINKGIQQGLEAEIENGKLLCELQPSLDQVTVYVYSEPSSSRGANSISHEMLLSDTIPVIHGCAGKRRLVLFSCFAEGGVVGAVHVQYLSFGLADYQVSTLVHTGDTTSVAPPHENLFDTTVLDEPANP